MDLTESSPHCMAQFVNDLALDSTPTYAEIDAIEAAGVMTVGGNQERLSDCLNRFDLQSNCPVRFVGRSGFAGSCALGTEINYPCRPAINSENAFECEA